MLMHRGDDAVLRRQRARLLALRLIRVTHLEDRRVVGRADMVSTLQPPSHGIVARETDGIPLLDPFLVSGAHGTIGHCAVFESGNGVLDSRSEKAMASWRSISIRHGYLYFHEFMIKRFALSELLRYRISRSFTHQHFRRLIRCLLLRRVDL